MPKQRLITICLSGSNAHNGIPRLQTQHDGKKNLKSITHSLDAHVRFYMAFLAPFSSPAAAAAASAGIATGALPENTANKYIIIPEIKLTTCPTAKLHTWIDTLPMGALGNDRPHSTYPGTHPSGIQNIGSLLYQNSTNQRSPEVSIHLIARVFESNATRAVLIEVSAT